MSLYLSYIYYIIIFYKNQIHSLTLLWGTVNPASSIWPSISICFNKSDLDDEGKKEEYESIYRACGFETISVSAKKENGLDVLEEICPLSARMVVNQVSMKMENKRITEIIDKIRKLDEK